MSNIMQAKCKSCGHEWEAVFPVSVPIRCYYCAAAETTKAAVEKTVRDVNKEPLPPLHITELEGWQRYSKTKKPEEPENV